MASSASLSLYQPGAMTRKSPLMQQDGLSLSAHRTRDLFFCSACHLSVDARFEPAAGFFFDRQADRRFLRGDERSEDHLWTVITADRTISACSSPRPPSPQEPFSFACHNLGKGGKPSPLLPPSPFPPFPPRRLKELFTGHSIPTRHHEVRPLSEGVQYHGANATRPAMRNKIARLARWARLVTESGDRGYRSASS
jgi:hypothetical protein